MELPSTRKVAIAHAQGQPVQLEEQAMPVLPDGGVLIRVLFTLVRGADKAVLSGVTPLVPPFPIVPGVNCVGIVVKTAANVSNVKPGDTVLTDAYLTSHYPEYNSYQQRYLIGLAALGPAPSLEQWKNGSWTDYSMQPAECLHIVPAALRSEHDLCRMLTVGNYAIAYGALLRGEMKMGNTVLVSGASGHIGSCTVQIALAMGAKKVYAVGRRAEALKAVVAFDPHRVIPVVLDPLVSQTLPEQIIAVTGPMSVDLHVDFLGYTTDNSTTLAAMGSLRVGGTSVFAGGVNATLPINYGMMLAFEQKICGSFMYPRNALSIVMAMMESKVVNINHYKFVKYNLSDVSKCMDEASETSDPYTIFMAC
jgi:alcohol dehydrogenase